MNSCRFGSVSREVGGRGETKIKGARDHLSLPKKFYFSLSKSLVVSSPRVVCLLYLCEVQIIALQIQSCFMWLLRLLKHYIINNTSQKNIFVCDVEVKW